jgi:hypothetical protein
LTPQEIAQYATEAVLEFLRDAAGLEDQIDWVLPSEPEVPEEDWDKVFETAEMIINDLGRSIGG